MNANTKRLYKDVEFLTSIYPYRNYKNRESLKKASDYIKNEFNKIGLTASTQSWKAKGNTYKNIIASYLPQKKKRFIIGAHYDVYKEQPGADDNASSVAGLLELARLAQKQNLDLEYGIDFVSFCLEEPPFFKTKEMGSYVHAQSLNQTDQDYIGMIALEMIGYYKGKPQARPKKKKLIISGIKKYDAFNKYLTQLLEKPGKLESRRLSFADNYRNNGPSDHRNYWPRNIPAVMVIGSGGNGNPNYHKSSDTIETLDFKTMTHAVNSLAHAVFNFELNHWL